MTDGFLDRTHKRITSGWKLLLVCIIIGGGAYYYSGDILVGVVAAIIVVIIFSLWDIFVRVGKIEREMENLKKEKK